MSTECNKQKVDVPVRCDQVVVDSKITAQVAIGHYATWDPGKFVGLGFLACWLVKQMACIKWLYNLLKDLLLKTDAVVNIMTSIGSCLCYFIFRFWQCVGGQ